MSQAAFAEDFAVGQGGGTVEMSGLVASRSRANCQGRADAVRVPHRIGHRKEADVLEVISGEQAEAGSLGRVGNSVKLIGHKNVVHIHADLGIRRTITLNSARKSLLAEGDTPGGVCKERNGSSARTVEVWRSSLLVRMSSPTLGQSFSSKTSLVTSMRSLKRKVSGARAMANSLASSVDAK